MSNLGSMLTLEYGEAMPAEARSGYGFPVFGSNGEVGRHRKFLIAEPGIIVGRKGSVGKVTWSDEPFWPIDTTYWVRCAPEDRRWVYWVLTWLPLARLDSSTGVPGLNRNDVYALTVGRPGLREREKIAQVLDTLDIAIHETEAIIAKFIAVKQGLLHDLLTRGIDANGELRSPQAEAPQLYKQSPLGWIPKQWGSKQLQEMVATNSPITYGVVQPGPEVEGGVPFIRGGDIYGGRILVEQLRTISQRISNGYRRTQLRGGEILMSLVGYPGEVGIVPIGLAGANIARQAALIRLADQALASYVMHYLSSVSGKRKVLGQRLGSAQQVVNLGDLRAVRIPLPPPDEAAEVARRAGAANERLNQEISELSKLRESKAGLMDDLLTGHVRVTPLLAGAEREKECT